MREMNEYRWRDAAKGKPKDGTDVLVCFSGEADCLKYNHCFSVGCYWGEDDEWELQEFGGAPAGGIQVHGWKKIEPFDAGVKKTILEDLLEKYPNVPMDATGTPDSICPCNLGYEGRWNCGEAECNECWNRPLEVAE